MIILVSLLVVLIIVMTIGIVLSDSPFNIDFFDEEKDDEEDVF